MKKNLKKKWVEALRSGDFSQTTGRLHREIEPGVDSFCCLGVLCEVSKAKSAEHRPGDRHYTIKEDNYDEAFTGLTQGMLDKWGIEREQQDMLIELNDTKKQSFVEIADYVEKNL